MRREVMAVVLAVAFAACGRGDSAADSARGAGGGGDSAGARFTVQQIGETGDMKTPESVRYDPDQDVYFVSNIDGNPSQKDRKGAIVTVRADSTGVTMPFVESGKNGATLNAPKGMAIQGDTLWVADIDAVRGFNRRTGAPVATIDLGSLKATFLNDIAVGGDGALYVTDTGISFGADGQMTHPGVDRIFRISGRSVTEAAKGDSLQAPNGITWDASNNRFLIAPFSGNAVLTWTPGGAAPATLATGPGQYDGIEVLNDGTVLVSSWADSAVHVIRNGQLATLATGTNSPADIGIDSKRNVLAVPLFSENKVVYFGLR
jgi:sugar lactone lactonase YvrE